MSRSSSRSVIFNRPSLFTAALMTTVNCPTCAAKVEWTEASKFRPFCSDRCKQIDLGAWAEEKYTIPATNPLDDTLEDGEAQTPGTPPPLN